MGAEGCSTGGLMWAAPIAKLNSSNQTEALKCFDGTAPPFPSNVGGRQKVKGSLKGKSYNQGSCLGQGCRSLSPPFLAMTSALFPALGEHTKIKDRSLPMPPLCID